MVGLIELSHLIPTLPKRLSSSKLLLRWRGSPSTRLIAGWLALLSVYFTSHVRFGDRSCGAALRSAFLHSTLGFGVRVASPQRQVILPKDGRYIELALLVIPLRRDGI